MSDAPEEVEAPEVTAPTVGGTKLRGPWSAVRSIECAKPKTVAVNGKKLAAKEFSHAKGVLSLDPAEVPSGIVLVEID